MKLVALTTHTGQAIHVNPMSVGVVEDKSGTDRSNIWMLSRDDNSCYTVEGSADEVAAKLNEGLKAK